MPPGEQRCCAKNLNLTGKPHDFPVVSFSKARSEKCETVFGQKSASKQELRQFK